MNNENNSNKLCLTNEDDNKKIEYMYDYSKFVKDGFELDEELLTKFQPIAQKLNLSQESIDLLMEIALEMSKKQRAIYIKDEETRYKDDVAKYDKMFNEDPQLPKIDSNDAKAYMKIANDAYRKFASDDLKELFKKTGLNYHPEFIKMFHKIGELMEEDSVNFGGKPTVEKLTPAQILYGPRK